MRRPCSRLRHLSTPPSQLRPLLARLPPTLTAPTQHTGALGPCRERDSVCARLAEFAANGTEACRLAGVKPTPAGKGWCFDGREPQAPKFQRTSGSSWSSKSGGGSSKRQRAAQAEGSPPTWQLAAAAAGMLAGGAMVYRRQTQAPGGGAGGAREAARRVRLVLFLSRLRLRKTTLCGALLLWAPRNLTACENDAAWALLSAGRPHLWHCGSVQAATHTKPCPRLPAGCDGCNGPQRGTILRLGTRRRGARDCAIQLLNDSTQSFDSIPTLIVEGSG